MRIIILILFFFSFTYAHCQNDVIGYHRGYPIIELKPNAIIISRDSSLVFRNGKYYTIDQFDYFAADELPDSEFIMHPDSIAKFVKKHPDLLSNFTKEKLKVILYFKEED